MIRWYLVLITCLFSASIVFAADPPLQPAQDEQAGVVIDPAVCDDLTIAKCTQLPIRCTRNSDCTCSGCCAQLGEGGPTVCQPNCNRVGNPSGGEDASQAES